MTAYLKINTTALENQNVNPVVLNLSEYVGPAPTGVDPDYEPSYNPKIGFSNYSSVIFPSRRNISLAMVFTVFYQPDRVVGLIRDPTFAEILNVCGVLGSKRPARIAYSAASTVSSLRSLGYVPKVDGTIGINCPATTEQISAFQDSVKGEGQDPIEALKRVFGDGKGPVGGNSTA